MSSEPNVLHAPATLTAAAGSMSAREPTGAIMTGSASLCPRNVVEVSMRATSLSTRGRKTSRSSPWRLRRSVTSDSVPPLMKEIPYGGLYFAVSDQQHLLQRREFGHG